MSYFNKILDSIIPTVEKNYGVLQLPNTIIDSTQKKIIINIPFKNPFEITYKKLGNKYVIDSNMSKDIESVNIKNLLVGLAPIKHVDYHGSLAMDKVVENCLLHTFLGASKSYSLEKFMGEFSKYDINDLKLLKKHFGADNIDYEELKKSLKMHSYLYHLANDIHQDKFYYLMYMLYNRKINYGKGIDHIFDLKTKGLIFSENNPYIDLVFTKNRNIFNVDLGYKYKVTHHYNLDTSVSQHYSLNQLISDKDKIARTLNNILTGIIKKDIELIRIQSFNLLEEVITDTPFQIGISNLLSTLHPQKMSVINAILEPDTYQWYNAAYELLNPGINRDQQILNLDFNESTH